LDGAKKFDASQREAIIGILRDTKKDLPAWFGSAN